MPPKHASTVSLVFYASVLACPLFAQVSTKVDFARDIQPILRQHCVECHGPSQQMRGLRLDRRRDAIPNRVGANGARITPGNSAVSPLFHRIAGTAKGPQMPPAGPLSAAQIELVKAWIDQGAEWPDALSGDRVVAPPGPAVAAMLAALREGNHTSFRRTLSKNPKSANAAGHLGWTPLMYAALYRDSAAVQLLLDAGANANARNLDGATALIYAIEDPATTKLLLERGADPNLRTGQGLTALLIAAQRNGSYPVTKLLLDKGADVKARAANGGQGALAFAAAASDLEVMKLLLDRGVDKKPLPLAAASRGCAACLDLLLPYASTEDLGTLYTAAVRSGDVPRLHMLLERGAKPGRAVLQNAALTSAPIPSDTVRALIRSGADINAKTSFGISTLELARRQGNKTVTDALLEAGVRDDSVPPTSLSPTPAASPRAAVERSMPPLQRSAVLFIERAGCVSCHNNSLTSMTVEAARARRLPIDAAQAREQVRLITAFLEENRESALENIGIPGGVDTLSYILLGLAADQYTPDSLTDVWARYIKNLQSPDGRWRCQSFRPPLESSDFAITAAAIRAIRTYAPKSQHAEYEAAAARAVRWLESAQPSATEDYTFKILGQIWGGGNPAAVRKTAQDLLALQRPDGAWGQTPLLAPDAYATGQALTALHKSAVLSAKSPAYQRGIQYLLKTQLADGSWFIRTRSPSFQPYFDSGFPHGHDQFISAAATNWAAMALIPVVR
ncbi:MAG: ankyrin repeat domain-containing protein [Acidobacteriota bacterium]